MKKILFATQALLLMTLVTNAQTTYDIDGLLETDLIGTARYVGMGGAMSAFGSDLSVISKNPAGIGTYNTNDVALTLSMGNSTTSNKSMGAGVFEVSESKEHSDINMGLDNMAFVITSAVDGDALKRVNVAMAYHKLNFRKFDVLYMDQFQDGGGYTAFRDYSNSEKDRLDAYDINLSLNFSDQLYWGVTMGLLDGRKTSSGYFYDYYPVQTGYTTATDFFSVDRRNTVDASGWRMGTGLIYRTKSGKARVGIAIQTPTFYNVHQLYEDYLYAENGTQESGDYYSQDTDFKFISPWIVNLSCGFNLNNSAIGFEYELANAESSSMRVSDTKIRTQIGDDLQSYSTCRLGYELNIDKMSIRIGYTASTPLYRTDAYKYLSDTDFNQKRKDLEWSNIKMVSNATLGLGYCSQPGNFGEQFYVDGAFILSDRTGKFRAGELTDEPSVTFHNRGHRFILSLGCCF